MAQADGYDDVRVWRLDRIRSIDLVDRMFTRADFELRAYAERSFGVWQEEPMDVVLRFAPEAAEDAAGWVFHPTQAVEREADGGLTARFRAGGVQEMCWHLFTWGTTVTVVEPGELSAALTSMAGAVLHHHAKP